jgi:hypothetical protein
VRGSEATGGNQSDALASLERSWRNLSGCLSAELQALKRCHPEVITQADYHNLRRAYLEFLALNIETANATADHLAMLRSQLDEYRRSQGHH